jgi:hypothetical protein
VTRVVVVRDGRIAADEPASANLRARYRAMAGGA